MKIGICGATGYSGRELVRILLCHPKVEIAFLSSEQFSGKPFSDVFPEFRSRMDKICQKIDSISLNEKLDLVFLALPHTVSMKMAKLFLQQNIRVIDLSGDYRLPQELYEKWYHHPHQDAQNLSKVVYGLSEIFREKIKKAQFISNPGCYPTSASLGLIPAISKGWIELEGMVIDAKSGASGAGRNPSLTMHFCEVYDNIKAYKIGVHQHTPEIEQILSVVAKKEIHLDFVPHLIPIQQGILSTMYTRLKKRVSTSEILASYLEFYKNDSFIRMLPEGVFPQTADVKGTNFCDIGLHVEERTQRLIIVSAIDNMVKGAAGQAVQNMNLMSGFPEVMALQ
ncbi:MAG: N-acetyl-gamma-glutamyl-phosphate reductase [Chlamydiae bacterium]|nr:N-acetyl-gamma-glutamyl-phosphate reductase [Chlamydiota bacterium]MBI3277673.1 N-acetyl-gamma-glutamyl-phosphate reductase [Chlamydiota bacterium]